MLRRLGPALVVALVALALAAAAAADKEKVHYNAADQAKARTMVLRRADLGSAKDWAGGIKAKPTSNTPITCAGFAPKQGDLVLTGKAESDFANAALGVEFDSQVELLRTERMVKLDWQRAVDAPALVSCLKQEIVNTLPRGESFISFKRVGAAKLGDEMSAFRGLISVQAGKSKVTFLIDFTLVGVGRSEITLITTAPYAEAKVITAAEERLAQTLAARAVPAGAA